MSLQRSYLDLPFLVSLVELPARAAEIKLLCAVALHPAIDVLIPDFENSSGHKVTVAYGNEGAIADRFQKGEAADRMINAAPLMDRLRAQGNVVAGDRIIMIAKVGVSAFVRKGAAKPDISSADAFKRSGRKLDYLSGSSRWGCQCQRFRTTPSSSLALLPAAIRLTPQEHWSRPLPRLPRRPF